jgi:hypothetical protein
MARLDNENTPADSAFQLLATEYISRLNQFTAALEQQVSSRIQETDSITEVRRELGDYLINTITTWNNEYVKTAYPIRLKRVARRYLGDVSGARLDIVTLEDDLDKVVEKHLVQFMVPDKPMFWSMPTYVKPALISVGAATGASLLVVQLTRGVLLFAGGSATIILSSALSWKLLQLEVTQTRKEIGKQVFAFISNYRSVMETYFQQTTSHIERETAKYVQQLGHDISE